MVTWGGRSAYSVVRLCRAAASVVAETSNEVGSSFNASTIATIPSLWSRVSAFVPAQASPDFH